MPSEKQSRVANYAHAVKEDLMVVTRSLGLRSPAALSRDHLEVIVAIGQRMRASDLYPYPPLALQAMASPEVMRRFAPSVASGQAPEQAVYWVA